jgi:hypothetical protein
MGVERWPSLILPYSICSHPDCAKTIPKGFYYCADHAKKPHPFRQSESVSPKQAARNAMAARGECYVYAIAGGEFVKFGKATNVQTRLSSMQTGSPIELVLLGSVLGPKDLEAEVHAWAAPHLHRGEWFKRTEPIERLIECIRLGDLLAVQMLLKITLDCKSN